MSDDPVVERIAELHGKVGALEAKTELREERERKSPAELAAERGLPHDLVSAEESAIRRLTPWRARWPQVLEYDQEVARLEQRQSEMRAQLQELHDRKGSEPGRHADRLARWIKDGERGPRPESELPELEARIGELQQDVEALDLSIRRVLADKAAYFTKHRKRLAAQADEQVERSKQRYLALIDQLADVRQELLAARRASVWAALFPAEQVAIEPRDTFAGGRKQPLQAMGLTAEVLPVRVLDALKADAEWCATAATGDQKALLAGVDPRQARIAGTVWTNDPRERAKRAQRMSEWATSKQ
jgi:hypothetical protein